MEKTNKQGEWIEKPFLELFCNAIIFSRRSETEEADKKTKRLFAQSGIIHSAFSLECAANCCLELFPFPSKRFRDNIDKLPILDKYEFLLFNRNRDAKFNRGSNIVQRAQEIVSLRDKYVHSKVKKQPMVFLEKEANLFEFKPEFADTNALKIPILSSNWEANHAVKVIIATVEFLNEFFINLCQFTAKETNQYLLSQMKIDENVYTMLDLKSKNVLEIPSTAWKTDVKFLDFTE